MPDFVSIESYCVGLKINGIWEYYYYETMDELIEHMNKFPKGINPEELN